MESWSMLATSANWPGEVLAKLLLTRETEKSASARENGAATERAKSRLSLGKDPRKLLRSRLVGRTL